jgi:pimeloyl-ACP methyl ester carboxylesterase
VLVVHGGDGHGPAAIAPLIAAELPAGEVAAAPERGHFGPLEDPAWFAGVVRRFLDAR